MPRLPTNPLTALKAKKLTAKGKYADGNGLYLEVTATGTKRWYWRGVVHGRRREVSIGPSSLYGLAEARERAQEWRRLAHQGIDPKLHRDAHKARTMTFDEAALQCWQTTVNVGEGNPKHKRQWLSTLETYASPVFGFRKVNQVSTEDVSKALTPIWLEKPETARRTKQRIARVFEWARTINDAAFDGVNPVAGVSAALPKQTQRPTHFAAYPYQDLPRLMTQLVDMPSVGATALVFLILTAARSGEVRGANWSEFDLRNRLWTVPASRMKARRAHRVPLSDFAITTVNRMRGLSSELVFPSPQSGKQLSDMTLGSVLRRLQISNKVATVHGFRSSFRDWTEEQTNFPHEVKEAALAHTIKNKAEAAYRRTDQFEKRRLLMRDWDRFISGDTRNV